MAYKRFDYDGPKEFCPMSAWGYLGYTIIFMIPVIGWVMLLYCAISSANINRRSYARFHILVFLISLLLLIVACGIIYAWCIGPEAQEILSAFSLFLRVLATHL